MPERSLDSADETSPNSELNETLARFQRRCAEGGVLAVDEQDQLRRLLPMNQLSEDSRRLVLALLNPREKPPIALRDLDSSCYVVVTEDNYSPLSDRGLLTRTLRFDTVSGYYVAPEVKPLW